MSLNDSEIEQRLTSLETAIQEVKEHVGMTPSSQNWVENISGSLADVPEEEYQQFLECCRRVRNGLVDSDTKAAQP